MRWGPLICIRNWGKQSTDELSPSGRICRCAANWVFWSDAPDSVLWANEWHSMGRVTLASHFPFFGEKKKKKRKSNCSLIGRRLLTNGDVQTLIEKNPLKKVRLLRIKGHETLTASALSTLIGGWFIANRWAIQSAPSGSSVNKSCWLDWQLDTLVRHQSYVLSCDNLNFIAHFHWATKIPCSILLVHTECRLIIKYYVVKYIQLPKNQLIRTPQ